MVVRKASASIGATIGSVFVIAVVLASHPGWGFFNHTECELGSRVGNVTAVVPAAIIAGPYEGSAVVSNHEWTNFSSGTVGITLNQSVGGGNVTASLVSFQNWTIYLRNNLTVAGIGPESPCSSNLVGFLSPRPALGGGVVSLTMATDLMSDIGLPLGFNGSELCTSIEGYLPDCAVGAQFDVNFHTETGKVDTCGSSQTQVISLVSQGMAVNVPYVWNGESYSVPLDRSNNATGGILISYSYSFPANTGVWEYDDLAQTSSTGDGLVFSFIPCD